MSLDEEIQSLLDEGLIKYGLGEVESALEFWKRVLQFDPKNPKALEYLEFVEENRRIPGSSDRPSYRPDETTDPTQLTLEQLQKQQRTQANTYRPADEIFDPKPSAVQKGVWGDLYGHVASSDRTWNTNEPVVQIPLDPAVEVPQPAQANMDPKTDRADASTPSTLPPLPAKKTGQSLDSDLEEISQEITMEDNSQEITLEVPKQDITRETPLAEAEPLEIEISIDEPEEQLVDTHIQEYQTNHADEVHPKPTSPSRENETKQNPSTQTTSQQPQSKISPVPPFVRIESQTHHKPELNQLPPKARNIQEEEMETESALDMVSAAEKAPDSIEEAPSELDSLLQGARDLLALDDFSGVLDLLKKIDEISPDHPEAHQMRTEAEQELHKMFSSKLGDLSQVPEVCMNQDEIIWLNLDHRAGFVLSLIDGNTSFDNILVLCGLPELDGMRILANLLQEKVIRPSR